MGCSNFAQIGTSPTTTYSDMGLASGASYSYRVRATDADNNLSQYSNTATAVNFPADTDGSDESITRRWAAPPRSWSLSKALTILRS